MYIVSQSSEIANDVLVKNFWRDKTFTGRPVYFRLFDCLQISFKFLRIRIEEERVADLSDAINIWLQLGLLLSVSHFLFLCSDCVRIFTFVSYSFICRWVALNVRLKFQQHLQGEEEEKSKNKNRNKDNKNKGQ